MRTPKKSHTFKLLITTLFLISSAAFSMTATETSTSGSEQGGITNKLNTIPQLQPIEDITSDTTLYSTVKITSGGTVDGNYSTWTVNPKNPNFRAIDVNLARRAVTIQFLTLVGGQISYQGDTEDGYGGTMYIKNGIVYLYGVNMMSSNACRGGAIYIGKNTTATLTGCNIQYNSATKGGCGVYIASGATVWINSCNISSNTDNSSGANGAGIYLEPGATLFLRHTTVSNGIVSGNGGGIYNDGGTVYVQNGATITDNSAYNGGGIYNNGGTVSVQSGATITDNSAYNGGGIYSVDSGVFVDDSNITFNNALGKTNNQGSDQSGLGGGIYIGKTATSSILNSNISCNNAKYGGGIYIEPGTTSTNNNITYSTFNGNYGKYGGGIFNAGNLSVISSTISNNYALGKLRDLFGACGGGIFNYGKLYLLSSIVVNNKAPFGSILQNGADIYRCNNSPSSSGKIYAYFSWYNKVASYLPGTPSDPTINTENSAPNIFEPYESGDLGPLIDNGGDTLTMALASSAPAVEKGTFIYCHPYYRSYYRPPEYTYFKDLNGNYHCVTDWTQSPPVVDTERVTTDQREYYITENPPSVGSYSIDATPLPPTDD